jgi:hypothetical protein
MSIVFRRAQPAANLIGDSAQLGIADRRHRSHGVHRGHLDCAVGVLLHDHVAGQHGPDLVFRLQRAVGEGRIAGAENQIRVEVHVDFAFSVWRTSIWVRMPKPRAFNSAVILSTAAWKSIGTVLLK